MGKSGGYRSPTQNRKGVPNKVNAATRERIEAEADPIGFLCRVQQGHPVPKLDENGEVIGYEPVTNEQQLNAAKELLKKVSPDLKAVEVTGGVGGSPIVFQFNSPIAPPNSDPQDITPPTKALGQDQSEPLAAAQEVTETVAVEVVENDD